MKSRSVPWPLRIVLFLVLVCLSINVISGPLIYPYADRVYATVRGLYEEPAGSLDAVFIGSSNTFVFWMPMFAWKEYGIASYNYAVPFQKTESYRYLIEEARKTQPDALYVISIGNPSLHITKEHVHVLTDYMRHSLTRTRLIRSYARYSGFSYKDQLELLLPFLIYHFRWDELTAGDFSRNVFERGPQWQTGFLDWIEDVSGQTHIVTERAEPKAWELEVITDLLDELDRNQVRVLFLNPPQFKYSDDDYARLNSLLDLIEERGYPVLRAEEIMTGSKLDPEQDFSSSGHTNVHGAAKYTHFVARYLLEHYGFSDKRGNPNFERFDTAYEESAPYFSPFVLDFELMSLPRASELKAPELLSAEWENHAVHLSWSESPGADGYRVYRKGMIISEEKTTETAWEALQELGSTQLQFSDRSVEEGVVYTYTVVPLCFDEEGGHGICYGNFRYHGISTQDLSTVQPGVQKKLPESFED